MILTGSSAIRHWFPSFNREPKDIDYIVDENEAHNKSTRNVEYLINPVISKLYKRTGKTIIEANDLCTLKASHLCWDLSWEKHMWDLQYLLKNNCTINPDLFFELYDYWNTYHTKNKRSDLKMSKEDFFDNAINYNENQHDDIHKIINGVPIYTLVLKDSCEVELDENKFYNLNYEQKMNFVREEVMVMAYERYRSKNYRVAYSKMLKKFIISHDPLFSLLFILTNYIELNKCPFNFINKINEHNTKPEEHFGIKQKQSKPKNHELQTIE